MEQRDIVRIALFSSLGTMAAVLVIGIGGYFAYTAYLAGWIQQYQIEQQSKAIIDEVGKVVLLPVDETPQVATILDAAQLKQGDEFFASAKNGDATIFYEKNGLVVLFDLKAHKLLNMGTLATTSSGASPVGVSASNFNVNK